MNKNFIKDDFLQVNRRLGYGNKNGLKNNFKK